MMLNKFKRILISIACLLCLITPSYAQSNNPHVRLQTNYGDIVLELLPDKAPISVENFLRYVDSGFYNDTIFHRVIPNFMIQGGGFTQTMVQKDAQAPIKNEADNGLKNERGSIAMARTNIVNSATSQFFINTTDNNFLNHGQRDFGYAVFGKVVEGMDIVDKIAKTSTTVKKGYSDVPVSPVIILTATRLQ